MFVIPYLIHYRKIVVQEKTSLEINVFYNLLIYINKYYKNVILVLFNRLTALNYS